MNDVINSLYQFLSQIVLPNWPDLIPLLPWVLIAILVVSLIGITYAWIHAMTRTASRVPKPLRGGSPPAGIHMPGPSRWPFVAPIGAAVLLFSFVLAPKNSSGNVTAPFNIQLFALGLIVVLISIGGWLWDAMREWRQRYGRPPSSTDWSGTHARRRGGEALERFLSRDWPAPSTVIEIYGSWPAARRDAFPDG